MAIDNFRKTIQSIWKPYFGLIARGSLNFWIGFTTERNLEESSEEANERREFGDVFAQSCAMCGYVTYEFIVPSGSFSNSSKSMVRIRGSITMSRRITNRRCTRREPSRGVPPFKVDCLRFLVGSDQPERRVPAMAFELPADEGFAAAIGFEA